VQCELDISGRTFSISILFCHPESITYWPKRSTECSHGDYDLFSVWPLSHRSLERCLRASFQRQLSKSCWTIVCNRSRAILELQIIHLLALHRGDSWLRERKAGNIHIGHINTQLLRRQMLTLVYYTYDEPGVRVICLSQRQGGRPEVSRSSFLCSFLPR